MSEKKQKRKVERRAVAKVINVQPPRPADDLFNPFAEAKAAERAAELPQYRSTELPEPPQVSDFKEQPAPITAVPNYRSTELPQYRTTAVPESNYYKKANEAADALDRNLTPAESKVFEHLVRLTVGFNRDERQVRISVLTERTGYGSDKTVRMALAGLERKGVIARIGRPNNPGGITYRILSYSGTSVPEYSGRNYPGTAAEITGELKTDLKEQKLDDDAFADFVLELNRAAKDITGRELTASDRQRLKELAEVLTTELRIAAGRTTVSSVPAFLAEHLRRRLWKKDKRQIEAETSTQRQSEHVAAITEDISTCPDCSGALWWYPNGYEGGVARCQHLRLSKSREE